MNMKERLNNYIELNKEIDYEITRLEQYAAKIQSIRSPAYNDLPKAPYLYDRIGEMIVRKEEIESGLHELMKQRDGERLFIISLVARLSKPEYKAVVLLRYIDLKGWNEVIIDLFGDNADFDINYDNYKQRMFRHHKKALSEMDQMTDKEVKEDE